MFPVIFICTLTGWSLLKTQPDLSNLESKIVSGVFLRFFYQQFDGIFVLNSDYKKWLSSHEMQIAENKIFLTSHWVKPASKIDKQVNFNKLYKNIGIAEDKPVPTLFFAGRISEEKGIFDFPDIYKQVKKKVPNIHLIIAGTGPAEKKLKQALPEAHYLGWVDKKSINKLYHSLDLFIFPSRFDTFGNVVLEAFAQGMPVIAYNLKGPKDIIQDGINGYLVNDKHHMAEKIIDYFSNTIDHKVFKSNAIKRCQSDLYHPDIILSDLQRNIQLI